MNLHKSLFILFIAMVIFQLFVPFKMILDKEIILRYGTEFKFITAPIDPHDPFRGKYISLQFDESLIEIPTSREWLTGEPIYLILTVDDNGFARVDSATEKRPSVRQHYLKTKVRYYYSDRVRVTFPFDRFYMEESKAYDAEMAYQESQTDTSATAYALVSIKDGVGVLKDVLIDGVPIREIARQRNINRQEK